MSYVKCKSGQDILDALGFKHPPVGTHTIGVYGFEKSHDLFYIDWIYTRAGNAAHYTEMLLKSDDRIELVQIWHGRTFFKIKERKHATE